MLIDPADIRLVFVVSGPSGSGKTTVCEALLRSNQQQIARAITTTTRPRRLTERDAEDYYFLTREEFEKLIAAGGFYENAEVHGQHYGVTRSEIKRLFDLGLDILLNIDIQGAETFRKKALYDALIKDRLVTIFLIPPNVAELEHRLHKRGTDDPQSLKLRMENFSKETARWHTYDYCIISRTPPEDLAKLNAIYQAERNRIRRAFLPACAYTQEQSPKPIPFLRAASESKKIKERLAAICSAPHSQPLLANAQDACPVVFGSLAREEWTGHGDIDWTLLVDGPAKPEHRDISLEFLRRIKDADFKSPTSGGPFGHLCFSHDLVHFIGGQADTNQNTTRRLLLLLESAALLNADVRDRVLECLLKSYLQKESQLKTREGRRRYVPRYLLNDIVRFWRMMAVDFGQKHRERGDRGWALRNVKLRFSRKLLFVSGILFCFSIELLSEERGSGSYAQMPLGLNLGESFDPQIHLLPVLNILLHEARKTPLQRLGEMLDRYALPDTRQRILQSYADFLELLENKTQRTSLDNLAYEEVFEDKLFGHARSLSQDFQEGLTLFFFHDHPRLQELTQEYAVF